MIRYLLNELTDLMNDLINYQAEKEKTSWKTKHLTLTCVNKAYFGTHFIN